MIDIPYDEQLVFDTVAEHLLKQGKRCVGDIIHANSCMYRNNEGLKCAAGCLIPDDQYTPYIEGKSWNRLVRENKVSYNCCILICDLQNIHDVDDPKYWLSKLHEIAKNKNLDTSKLPPLTE